MRKQTRPSGRSDEPGSILCRIRNCATPRSYRPGAEARACRHAPPQPAQERPKPGDGMYYVLRNRAPLDKYQRGDAVPEAFSWPRTESFVKLGYLQFIPDHPPQPLKRPEPPKEDQRAEAGPAGLRLARV